ncbi:Septin-domain-containing protein [Polychytrium aggregatum]|uniref:Septin-domain-containing protein n=1 Tax=Polychytrium aggregatum TaxID=110093 RepID=UPI0022FF2C84|nr:Septin-domain-containing protein [Polychytrium aggregatum]KAI9204071.1 Septin-domain-containing protein [Polychytrium aggregatum]
MASSTRDTNLYYVVAPYVPAANDELAASVGDRITILHDYGDGWAFSNNCSTGNVGLFPRIFLSLNLPPGVEEKSVPVPVEAEGSLSERKEIPDAPSKPSPSLNYPSGQSSSAAPPPPPDVSSKPDVTATGVSAEATSAADKRISKLPPNLPLPTPEVVSEPGPNREALAQKADEFKNAVSKRVPENIGSLRVAFVGDSGIGKTSLMTKFLAQEDIKIRDPLPPADASMSICEIRASTVATDNLLLNELPMNLTFVDTPGFGVQTDAMHVIRAINDYYIGQFKKTDAIFSNNIPPVNLIRFVRGNTGAHSHIVVTVYAILHRLTNVDLVYMRNIAHLCNLVPVLIKSDSLTSKAVFDLKKSILAALKKEGIKMYNFGFTDDELQFCAENHISHVPPFAVSSDVEDGPQLGSENEFDTLYRHILHIHIDTLRYEAAAKFAQWREATSKA